VSDATLAPGDRVQQYVVRGLLGEGAAAEVYRVDGDGQTFALKLLRTTEPRRTLRMEREAAALQRLAHPHVVRLREVVRKGERLGLVLELVEGVDLHRLIEAYLPTMPQVDDLAGQLFDGLAALHAAGIVHRDLKPTNVLLHFDDDRIVLKISDLGLARAESDVVSPRMTRSGAALGTPRHMPPEQHRSAKSADHRSDVFALGTVLYELLTGSVAFPGEYVVDIYEAANIGAYTPIRALRPETPQRMVDAVDAAMKADADERPENVEALAALWWGSEDRVRAGCWSAEQLGTIRRRASTLAEAALARRRRTPVPPVEAPVIRSPSQRPTVPSNPADDAGSDAIELAWWTLGGAMAGGTAVAVIAAIGAAVVTLVWWLA